jgi:hypothetical protein
VSNYFIGVFITEVRYSLLIMVLVEGQVEAGEADPLEII